MRFSLSHGIVDARTWRMESEMRAHIELFDPHIVLGKSTPSSLIGSFAYQPGLNLGLSASTSFGIGIHWTPDAFEPQLLVLQQNNLIVVGFESEIVALDKASLSNHFTSQFTTYFRAMFFLDNLGILALEEIGASLISLNGQVLWSVTKDIVTDVRLATDRKLHLFFMDSPSLIVDVATGHIEQERLPHIGSSQ